MKRFLVLAVLVLGGVTNSGCASGPPAGSSALAQSVGELVIAELPPGTPQIAGTLGMQALIMISEALGLTREEFREMCQSCYKAASKVNGQPPARSIEPSQAEINLASAYMVKLAEAGR